MRKRILVFVGASLVASAAQTESRLGNAADEAAILKQQQAAVQHDLKALGGNATLKDESSKLRFLTADVALLEINPAITGASNGPTLKEP